MTCKVYEVHVYADGAKRWYRNGQLHREDGPAVEWADGSKSWYRNGQPHREDGPAVEWSDGDKEWWLSGQKVTEDEVTGCNDKIVEIDGKRYKLQAL